MHIGQRLSFGGDLCTVRYIGEVQGTKGQWLGIEWDDPTRGKHNGEAGGVRYFECLSKEPTCASFIRPSRPADEPRTFLEALRYKYAFEHGNIRFVLGPKTEEKSIQISGKEVKEVGFEKIRKQLAELHELRIVLLDGLCISRHVDEATRRAWRKYDGKTGCTTPTDIREVCPKITELDLSRNLFEDWAEIVFICEQLPELKSLRIDGNRFKDVKVHPDERQYFRHVFRRIRNLHLENTLLTWEEMINVCSLFNSVQFLVLSNNAFTTLDPTISLSNLPSTIISMDLGSNDLTSLSDISTLQALPQLQTLILKSNPLTTTTRTSTEIHPSFSPTLTTLDLSHAQIQTWTLIDTLPPTFPGLASLRISHNPLFASLTGPDHRILSTDDGYMLTIARLPNLKSLNYSTITAKDRLNAESYYLSLIVLELSLAPEAQAETILKKHRRWKELCDEYGEPEIKRSGNRINPNSLAARLLTLNFHLDPSASAKAKLDKNQPNSTTFTAELPKSLSIYAVLGIVGKHFGLPAMRINLIYETAEWDIVNKGAGGSVDGPWDSSDESGNESEGVQIDWGERRVRREVLIVPGTRGIGSYIDGSEATIRISL
ncbi:tubulin-specific chaperone E [Tothia fuscella]|uniref:Tubulin-specific chaperone E n=1 Tax=Tothia fuscella TaxID=1048955 RepID=A0A9P4NTD6_9PEZI|nr:tubulin-specific chaperone E [Tothia fuscella]